MSAECRGKGIQGRVPHPLGDFGQWDVLSLQEIACHGHSPVRQVPHRRIAENFLEYARKRRARHVAESGQFLDGPPFAWVPVYRLQGARQARIRGSSKPCGSICTACEAGSKSKDHQDVQQPVEHRLTTRLDMREFPGKEGDHAVYRIVHPRGNRQHRRQSSDESGTNVPREAIGATEEHRRPWIEIRVVHRRMPGPEILRQDAACPRLVGDEVIGASSNQRQVARLEFKDVAIALRP